MLIALVVTEMEAMYRKVVEVTPPPLFHKIESALESVTLIRFQVNKLEC